MELQTRRRFLKTAGAVTSGLLLSSGVGSATSTGTDVTFAPKNAWPTSGGTTGNTRATHAPGPSGPYLQTQWTGGDSKHSFGSPVVANDVLYFGVTPNDGGREGAVIAYDAASGEHLWTRDQVPKQFQLSSESGGSDRLGAPSQLSEYNGSLYISCYGMESPNYGDGLMGIYSLNGATGEIQWRRPDIDPAEIEVANDRVYFAGGALDATTGTSIWEIDGQDDLMGVTGDTLYTCRWDSTAQTTVITARDAATGTKLWSITRDFKTVKTVITSDTVYVTTTTSEQEPSFTVTALAATDGSLQWQSPVPVRGTSPTIEYSLDGTEKYTVDRDPYLSEPAVDSSRFYILTRAYEDDIIDGVKQPHGEYLDSYSTLYAFDRSTGDEVWRFETPAQALAAPTVTDNTVYFACKYHEAPDGDSISWGTPAIYALNAGTGAKQWVSAFNASSDSWITAPVVVDKRIFTTVQIIGNYPEIYALESTDCGESIPDEGAQTVRNDPDSKTNQMGRSESEITGSSASDGSAQLKANNPQGAQSVPPSQLSDHSLSIKAYDWQSPLAFIGGLGTSVGTYLSSHSPLRTDD